MNYITIKNYHLFKPSDFINSYKSDFKYFIKSDLHKLNWDIFDVGQIAILPFLNDIPKDIEDFQEKIEKLNHKKILDSIEMLFYQIGIGDGNCVYELSKLYKKVPVSILEKLKKCIGNFRYHSPNVNVDVYYTERIMLERINIIVKILKNNGY